jgi:signal peptidase II
MKDFKTRLLTVGSVVAITVGLDQWTKYLATNMLQGQPDQFYLNDVLRLTFARNTGAFLSLGSELGPVLRPLLLNAFPAILLIGLLWYIFREKELNRWQTVALALIVGGGLSNIVDRLLFGHVVDMLHLKVGSLQTGIFNVADMAIMAGMFIMIPFTFQKPPKEEAEPEASPGEVVVDAEEGDQPSPTAP